MPGANARANATRWKTTLPWRGAMTLAARCALLDKIPGIVTASGSIPFLLRVLVSGTLSCCGALAAASTEGAIEERFEGRSLIVFVPAQLPPPGTRALVVVFHGGLGNAQRIESARSEHGLNLDAVAQRAGFLVSYLNGTPATRRLGADKLGWNAGGGCCGVPAVNNVDDVGYAESAVADLVRRYGVDPKRVYGIGHSNGAMMVQRLMCETGVFAAGVAISGPLNVDPADCAAARGKKILAIHGAEDANVPIAGGRGTQGLSTAVYSSEERTRQSFANSGAQFDLLVVPGADHKLDHIQQAIERTESRSIAEKAAQFFGLLDRAD
jgi:polyhydroxybutyrate depolymerase